MSEFRLKKTNGIRKVRLGVDNFDERILDSLVHLGNSALDYGFVYSNLSLAAGIVQTGIIVHGAQPIRILLSMFPFSLFLARGKR